MDERSKGGRKALKHEVLIWGSANVAQQIATIGLAIIGELLQ